MALFDPELVKTDGCPTPNLGLSPEQAEFLQGVIRGDVFFNPVDEALNGKNSRDISEANVNQVDIGIAKGLAQQHNFIASSLNKNRYGSGNQQNIQINIGDLHLDALRKMKVVDHE